ncbi:hypothetical protein EMIHUDRAFT_123164, partial [Emiliania huxleyi CCMP1516]|uniref:FAD-binding FR-type domain-containing protein n=2 Tax=Emiliania huxleyi TaxID=2903 RepID=A0A0D3K360_EMIH1
MLRARRSRSFAYNGPQWSAARLCSGKASTTNPFAAAAAKKAAAASSTASTTNPFAAAAAKKAAAASSTASTTNPFAAAAAKKAAAASSTASTTNPFAAVAAKKAAAASSTANTTNPFAAAAAKKAAAKPAKKTWQPLKLTEKRRESDTITSFVFVHTDGSAPISYEAGQYLPIRLSVPGVKSPVAEGVGSRHLHDAVEVGDTIEGMAPKGDFVLKRGSTRPMAFVSGGVGITPMIAMMNTSIAEGVARGSVPKMVFLHGARNGS